MMVVVRNVMIKNTNFIRYWSFSLELGNQTHYCGSLRSLRYLQFHNQKIPSNRCWNLYQGGQRNQLQIFRVFQGPSQGRFPFQRDNICLRWSGLIELGQSLSPWSESLTSWGSVRVFSRVLLWGPHIVNQFNLDYYFKFSGFFNFSVATLNFRVFQRFFKGYLKFQSFFMVCRSRWPPWFVT